MSERPSFIEELKRRKVVRVAIVYAAVSWAVLQVADIVVPALGLSEKMITGLVVLLVLGFPVTLALAWAFDVTPEGVKRAPKAEAATEDAGHGWVSARTVMAAVVLLAAGWAGGRFLHPAGGDDGGGAGSANLASVAVLPFRDLGSTTDSTHLADGIQDDILTQLGRIDALRVTSRTSVERYRDTDKDIPTIADELKVRAVLEGGVQRTPNRVRINVQLIDGGTDKHLWAESYDRALNADNVFAIQSEIARAVADALEAALTPEDERSLAQVPTHDLRALDLYHRGRSLLDSEADEDQVAAIPVLEEAVRRDSTYVRAWAALTRARSWQIRQGRDWDTLPARAALDRTLALAPGSAEAAIAEGNYLYYARGDYVGALEAFGRLSGAEASSADVTFFTANVLRRLGRWDETVDRYARVTRLEPENTRAFYELGFTYESLRRFGEADSALERAYEVAPDVPEIIHQQIDVALWGRGDTARARTLLSRMRRVTGDPRPDLVAADLAYVQRDPRALEIAAGVDLPTAVFDAYTLGPGGPVELWRARMAWALGDAAEARALSARFEPAFAAARAGMVDGARHPGVGADFFGTLGGLHAIRGWVAAFQGRRDAALAEADSAVALNPVEADALEGVVLLRQRALIRIVVGDAEGAVEDLRRVLELPGLTTIQELRLVPFYDSLRDRPDFQALIASGER